jgi:hypothetical protein
MKKDPTRSTRRVAAARPLARELCSTIDASETESCKVPSVVVIT